MTDVRACVLGCSTNGNPRRSAPGRLACDPCAERLAAVLVDIGKVYAVLTEVDELIPGGTGDGARSVPGPRSPAVDAILVHTDPRSKGNDRPAALAAVAGWAREIREETTIDTPPARMLRTVPAGRITMWRELQTIRFNWDWLLGHERLADFAAEMRGVLAELKQVGRMAPKVLQIGTCPVVVLAVPTADGDPVYLDCGATLRVRVGDVEIRCRNCGAVWTRERWHLLGDQWIDYAALSTDLDVPVGTLRRWCSLDGWTKHRKGGRLLVDRLDAYDSYHRHRGPARADTPAPGRSARSDPHRPPLDRLDA